MKKLLAASFMFLIMIACTENQNPQKESEEVTMLKDKIAKFVPVEIQYDETLLTDREKVVLEKLFRASKIIDELFLEQVYSKNNQLKSQLISDLSNKSIIFDKPELKLEFEHKLELFNIMFGPCLLYTSDAADERSSVDLGGRRIIKNKTKQYLNKISVTT